jgi:hypothetical protein
MTDNDFVIPIAIGPGGILVSPTKAEKGILYHCPECRDKIVFRKGAIKVPHFAHHGDSKCNPETILHKAGKLSVLHTIESWKAGTLPKPLIFKKHELCQKQSCYDLPECIERALMEHRIPSGRVLDVALMGPESVVLGVEIYVTHRVDAAKKSAVPYPWVEVDAQAVIDSPLKWICLQEADCFMKEECAECLSIQKARQEELELMKAFSERERERLARIREGKRRYVSVYPRFSTGPNIFKQEPVRLEWDASVTEMVARLREIGPAKEGFDLSAGISVLDPVKFHHKMLEEAKAGPRSAASRTGSFQSQLAQYLKARGETVS